MYRCIYKKERRHVSRRGYGMRFDRGVPPSVQYCMLRSLDLLVTKEESHNSNNDTHNHEQGHNVKHRIDAVCIGDTSNLVGCDDGDQNADCDDHNNDNANDCASELLNIHVITYFLGCRGVVPLGLSFVCYAISSSC